MIASFVSNMTPSPQSIRRAAALMLALLSSAVWAERADRERQMVVEADRPGSVDLQRQVVEFNGNVVITQGTMVIRADRVELRETQAGYRAATAIGTPSHQASYRQKRDGVDEFVEGVADRIEYDGRADTLRFVGNGSVRRLRGAIVADEITGSQIVWDASAETFNVAGGETTPANPSGRVRAVLSPRSDAAAPASAPASAAPLAPARTLGGKR
ncbi:lipopolysaccharide transport periplasmic protein LptA [Rubrivivax gelatinosus]|nr:lipopolysaccharide transport periplasmic protein LptA [Rubrivivax gelatinosus]